MAKQRRPLPLKGQVMSDDDEFEEEDSLSPHNVIDKVAFGRRLRALRVLQGFDRVQDFVAILRSRYGVDVSPRTVYAIERGEQMPHLDLVVASAAMLDAPTHYFAPAIRSDVVEALMRDDGSPSQR